MGIVKYIVGIDPSESSTGIAVVSKDGTDWRWLKSEIITPMADDDPDWVRWNIANRCALWVRSIPDEWRPIDRVIVELPSYSRDPQKVLRQSLLTGCIIGHVEAAGFTIQSIHTATYASHLQLGKDKGHDAKKAAAIAIARREGMPEDRGDDEADAVCLAFCYVPVDDAGEEEATDDE